jgi:hypothetical protein
MTILVDSNVIIDLINPSSPWRGWAADQIRASARAGRDLVINPIILAEVSIPFSSRRRVDEALRPSRFLREDLPWAAAFAAGKAYLAYRQRGGERRSPLPDFYIGAHAQARGYSLLTRDDATYRTYFPEIDIIAPDKS